MGEWIRKNLVLVAGIVLPVLLIAGFLVLERLPTALAEPPRHDFLVVAYRYDAQRPRTFHLDFQVREGRLDGIVRPSSDERAYAHNQHASLFRYSARERHWSEIVYTLPEAADTAEEPLTFAVTEAADLALDSAAVAPDGYAFEYLGYRGSGGLLGELFGMRSRRGNEYALSKGCAVFHLPNLPSPGYYYGDNLKFLGWLGDGPDTP